MAAIKHNVKQRSKYGSKPTVYNHVRYDSKAEAAYARSLDLRKESGDVAMWLRQIPLPCGAGVVYRCDFQVFLADGTMEYVDVKGFQTKMFKMKKKQVEALNPVEILVVK